MCRSNRGHGINTYWNRVGSDRATSTDMISVDEEFGRLVMRICRELELFFVLLLSVRGHILLNLPLIHYFVVIPLRFLSRSSNVGVRKP